MTLSALLLFVSIYALAVASPGPAVAAILARTLGAGTGGSVPFILGLIAGDLTWFAASSLGLSIIAQSYASLFQLIKYCGAAYLLFLAWQIWKNPVQPLGDAEGMRPAAPVSVFLGSYVLILGNPKTMVFFVSILPLVLDADRLGVMALIELIAAMCAVMIVVFGGYVVLAARARQVFRSRRSLALIQKTTAGMMAGTALAVVTR